jgi:hypothetical protein
MTIGRPTPDLEDDILALGPTCHVTEPQVVRELYHSYGTLRPPIKEAAALQVAVQDPDPFIHELVEHSAHPL